MHAHQSNGQRPPGSARVWLFWGFAAIGAFFLLTEHYAHVVPYLPWLLLAACPLMHLFGHGHGHGGHRHGDGKDKP